MPLTAAQLDTLRTEISTDPASLGYVANADGTNAAKLNASAVGNRIDRSSVTKAQLFACIDPTEFDALTDKKLQQWQCIPDPLNINDASTKGCLLKIFSGATTTIAAVTAFLKRDGSRAEALFGPGVVVSVSDISLAMRGAT